MILGGEESVAKIQVGLVEKVTRTALFSDFAEAMTECKEKRSSVISEPWPQGPFKAPSQAGCLT